ncbi:hypothetical protein [Gilliamella apicola]|uniref:Immunity protein 30 domain-containing protein n=1 Tax=Gilliamella apicola TaxID=1196095 RepID=A0A2V4DZC9_9GAMM|nr:hypothetical protein [Gilliamella apicola]PXZ03946.1 hypothetical protein DKK79_06075 [Gilliamella apicola]
MFDSFDKYISLFSDHIEANDYWHDIGSLHASELIDKFDNKDWLALTDTIINKSDNWLARFCESVDNITNIMVLPILTYAIERSNKELSMKALDAINSILSSNIDFTNYMISIKNAIDKVKPKADKVELAVLSSLENKISNN